MQREKHMEKAAWIWLQEEKDNQYVAFEAEFDAETDQGLLHISADSDYAAFINGALCAFNQYDDHPMHKAYDSVPVQLCRGKNTLRIHVWHQSSKGCYTYIPGPAGLIFALEDEKGQVLCQSRAGMKARPILQYRMGDVEPISGQLGDGFHYDASVPDAPWEESVEVSARANTSLYPRPVKKIGLHAPIDAKKVKEGFWRDLGGNTAAEIAQNADLDAESKDRYVIYDLGREEAGLLTLKVQGKAGGSLIICWGEHLETGRVLSYIEGRHFATTYTLRDGENEFTHYFRRLGGRYLQVMCKGDIQIDYVTVMPTDYPIECVSRFECEDALLKKIYDVSVRTLHLCMHEHYEDTPWREQALYAMDSRNQSLFGYCCFGEKDFPAAYLKLFQEGIRDDHLFELCAHAKERFTIPSFSLSWVMAARDHYLWTGDEKTARDLMGTVQEIVDGFIARIGEDGICRMPGDVRYWNFYEWTDGMDDQDIFVTGEGDRRPQSADAALNLYLILAMEAAGQMLKWLGEKDRYRAACEELKSKVRLAFYDAAEGAVRTHPDAKHYTEFNQSMALLCGIPDEEEAAALRKRLSQKENGFVPVSLSCTLMKYEALLMEKAIYADWVLDSIREIWGRMIDQGATSFWEVEEGASAYGWAGSLCHGWSAVPVYMLNVCLLGVVPTAPGFREYAFSPCASVRASGTVPAPFGGIKVKDGKLEN